MLSAQWLAELVQHRASIIVSVDALVCNLFLEAASLGALPPDVGDLVRLPMPRADEGERVAVPVAGANEVGQHAVLVVGLPRDEGDPGPEQVHVGVRRHQGVEPDGSYRCRRERQYVRPLSRLVPRPRGPPRDVVELAVEPEEALAAPRLRNLLQDNRSTSGRRRPCRRPPGQGEAAPPARSPARSSWVTWRCRRGLPGRRRSGRSGPSPQPLSRQALRSPACCSSLSRSWLPSAFPSGSDEIAQREVHRHFHPLDPHWRFSVDGSSLCCASVPHSGQVMPVQLPQ